MYDPLFYYLFRAEVYYQTMNIQTITQSAKYDVSH